MFFSSDKKTQFLASCFGAVAFLLLALLFGFTAGWGSFQAIVCYVGFGAFACLSGLAYYWWKQEEK